MSNVVNMKDLKKSRKVQMKTPTEVEPKAGYDFVSEILGELDTLSAKLGITSEEALNVIKDFYRRYPMTLEYVRAPEVLLYQEKLTLERLMK